MIEHDSKLSKQLAAEFFGTFAIVLFGCGAIMIGQQFPGTVTHTGVAVSFGLIVTVMIYAVGHLSGAHMNPAVTLAFSLSRHFPSGKILPFWLSQLLGAFAAIALLAVTFPNAASYGGTHPVLPPGVAFLWEFLLTYLLMFVIMSVATDARAVGIMAGVAIGATVILEALVAGPLTGASMNPARSIAPLMFEHNYSLLWIYLLAPMFGACCGSLTYKWIRG